MKLPIRLWSKYKRIHNLKCAKSICEFYMNVYSPSYTKISIEVKRKNIYLRLYSYYEVPIPNTSADFYTKIPKSDLHEYLKLWEINGLINGNYHYFITNYILDEIGFWVEVNPALKVSVISADNSYYKHIYREQIWSEMMLKFFHPSRFHIWKNYGFIDLS
jgi:hypothetical protein